MVRRIARRFHPQAVVLFDSHARGTANADSDVDLLVVMSANGSRRNQTVESYGLLAGMGQPKDVIIVTPEEVEKFRNVAGTIVRMALREGKILYGRLA
jgi:predicted nucleotidyltransferase